MNVLRKIELQARLNKNWKSVSDTVYKTFTLKETRTHVIDKNFNKPATVRQDIAGINSIYYNNEKIYTLSDISWKTRLNKMRRQGGNDAHT